MSKYIVVSDIHAHKYRAFNHGNRRLNNISRLLDELWALAEEHGADLLIPGDLFNTMQVVQTEAMVMVMDSFRRNTAKYPNIKCSLISGNHDFSTKNLYDNPAVSAIASIHGISDNVCLIDNTYWNIGGNRIYGLPYYEYESDLRKALTDLSQEAENFKGRNILLMHQTIGFGHDLVPDDIDPGDSLFKPFDIVFNGHIHKFSIVRGMLYNVGSPIHRDAGDVGKEKGVLLYDSETDKVERIILTGYPQYRHLPESQPQPPEWDEDYVIVVPEQIEVSIEEEQVREQFNHHKVSRSELINNYIRLKDVPEELSDDIHTYGNKLLDHA